MSVLELGFFILNYFDKWKLFAKANEPGWKALIPYYSQYIYCKIGKCSRFYFVDLLLTIALQLMTVLTVFDYALEIIEYMQMTHTIVNWAYLESYVMLKISQNIPYLLEAIFIIFVILVLLTGLHMYINYKFVESYTNKKILKTLAVLGTIPVLHPLLIITRCILAFGSQYTYKGNKIERI